MEAAYKRAVVAGRGRRHHRDDCLPHAQRSRLARRLERACDEPFFEAWLGREPELRRRREEVWARLDAAEESDPDYGLM